MTSPSIDNCLGRRGSRIEENLFPACRCFFEVVLDRLQQSSLDREGCIDGTTTLGGCFVAVTKSDETTKNVPYDKLLSLYRNPTASHELF